jgi:fructose-1-phosphate kinase PfkB-like protein
MLSLHRQGIEIVALSRGEGGLIATDGVEIWDGVLQVETIVNVVGCGDSQLAGITKQVLEKAPLKELIRWGVACGTANTQVRGAGRIEMDTVLEMLARSRDRACLPILQEPKEKRDNGYDDLQTGAARIDGGLWPGTL